MKKIISLTILSILSTLGAVAQIPPNNIYITSGIGDKISLHENRLGQTNMYGFGVENATLYSKTVTNYRWYISNNADNGINPIMALDPNKFNLKTSIHANGKLSLVQNSSSLGDIISLYGNRLGNSNMYGFGIETNGGIVYSKAVNGHNWYVNSNADQGNSAVMKLNSTELVIDGNIDIGSGISGNPNYNDVTIGNATSNRGIQIFSAGHSGVSFHDDPTISSTSRASYDGGIYYNHTDDEFQIWSSKQRRLSIDHTGNVGIGTTTPQSKLAVNGQIRATEVKVLADISVPDYVFETDYDLRTLRETKEYITQNKHLPEIPSASEIGENGIDLGDMNMRLLKKIEELTLYQIELMEKLEEQQKRIEVLENGK